MPEVMDAPVSQAPATTKAPKAKKPAAKKAGKAKAKATNGKPKAKKESKPRGPNKTQLAVLKLLNKAPDGLTRSQLSDKLESFIGGKIMGHVDPKLQRANSLAGRGLVKLKGGEPRKLADGSFSETEGACIYAITAAGKKVLESA